MKMRLKIPCSVLSLILSVQAKIISAGPSVISRKSSDAGYFVVLKKERIVNIGFVWTDKFNDSEAKGILSRIFITYGRVPLFYFILQMFVAHGFGLLLSLLSGKNVDYLFLNFPSSSTDAPLGAGFDLCVVYATWLAGLLLI